MEGGYKHINTASAHDNDEPIGKALELCFNRGKERKELFITAQIDPDDHVYTEAMMKLAIEQRKKTLFIDQFDLILLHQTHNIKTPKKPKITKVTGVIAEEKFADPMNIKKLWPWMERLVEAGITKSIGVSNFTARQVQDVLDLCKVKPVVNQIELNPQNVKPEFVKYLRDNEIVPLAYSPVARPGVEEMLDHLYGTDWPELRENPYFKNLAGKYNKTVI